MRALRKGPSAQRAHQRLQLARLFLHELLHGGRVDFQVCRLHVIVAHVAVRVRCPPGAVSSGYAPGKTARNTFYRAGCRGHRADRWLGRRRLGARRPLGLLRTRVGRQRWSARPRVRGSAVQRALVGSRACIRLLRFRVTLRVVVGQDDVQRGVKRLHVEFAMSARIRFHGRRVECRRSVHSSSCGVVINGLDVLLRARVSTGRPSAADTPA
jgi:hypothetical protein